MQVRDRSRACCQEQDGHRCLQPLAQQRVERLSATEPPETVPRLDPTTVTLLRVIFPQHVRHVDGNCVLQTVLAFSCAVLSFGRIVLQFASIVHPGLSDAGCWRVGELAKGERPLLLQPAACATAAHLPFINANVSLPSPATSLEASCKASPPLRSIARCSSRGAAAWSWTCGTRAVTGKSRR